MLLRLLLSKVTSNIIFMVMSLVFHLTFQWHLTQLSDLEPFLVFLLADWSFSLCLTAQCWSAPGVWLDPIICSFSPRIQPSANTTYMLMIPKSMFSAPTNPAFCGLTYLTDYWPSWMYNGHITLHMFKLVYDFDDLGPHHLIFYSPHCSCFSLEIPLHWVV